jgi:hypothetical protein
MIEIIAALAKALPEVGAAIKDANNPHFKSKYADLGSVIDAIRPVVAHGIWFRQKTVPTAGQTAAVETFYVHTSGQELSAGITDAPVTKSDAQGYGSALTYCRRYGLMAAFGIAPEDDDGNAASKAAPAKVKPEPVEPEPQLPPVDPADFALRWDRMLAMSDTLQALRKLREDTTAERAAVKAADAGMNARINAAYKARQQALMAQSITQAG